MHWMWRSRRSNDEQTRIEERPTALASLGQRFDQGSRLTQPIPLIQLVRDADAPGVLTDNLIAPGTTGLVFSTRLRALLASCGVTNIDYYPVVVVNPADGSSSDDYALANLIGRVTCFDMARSVVQMDPVVNQIEFIDSLVLIDDAVQGLRMFRAAEHSQVIVVHSDVRDACIDAGITGVDFERAEDFSM